MTSTKCRGRCCGVSDEAAESDPDDGDEAHGQGTEDHRLENAGMPERHLEVLAGEDPLADFEADDVGEQRHREHERRGDRSFGCQHPASRGRGGEGGPDHPRRVLGRHGPHAECREQHGADEDDAEQRAGRRVEEVALWSGHGGPLVDLGDAEDGTQADGYGNGHDGCPPRGGQRAKLGPLRLECPADRPTSAPARPGM